MIRSAKQFFGSAVVLHGFCEFMSHGMSIRQIPGCNTRMRENLFCIPKVSPRYWPLESNLQAECFSIASDLGCAGVFDFDVTLSAHGCLPVRNEGSPRLMQDLQSSLQLGYEFRLREN